MITYFTSRRNPLQPAQLPQAGRSRTPQGSSMTPRLSPTMSIFATLVLNWKLGSTLANGNLVPVEFQSPGTMGQLGPKNLAEMGVHIFILGWKEKRDPKICIPSVFPRNLVVPNIRSQWEGLGRQRHKPPQRSGSAQAPQWSTSDEWEAQCGATLVYD